MDRLLARLSVVTLLAFAPAAQAAEFYLRADVVPLALPDGTVVTLWGFAPENATFDSGAPAQVPGPLLEVPPGDDALIIHLRNNLPGINGLPAPPVSIVIPGQRASFAPVRFTDAQGRSRVRSFTQETPPGATGTYTWTGLRSGTYLYHSGTHPAVQVQMGLYGAVRHDAAAGEAYPGVAYDRDVVLLFSEIDPVLSAAIAAGSYGTGVTSTVNYTPRYFLVNGAPYSSAAAPMTAGFVGERVLVRMLNAGLQSHVPLLQGGYFRLLAEDGNPSPYPKQQYHALLPAGKTLDAVIEPDAPGDYALFDRRLRLTNGMAPEGGMLAFLRVATRPGAPAAVADSFDLNEDTPLAIAVPGVLANDSDPEADPLSAVFVTAPTHGALTLNADGSFNYVPAANYSGRDFFSYRANDGTLDSNSALVTLNVAAVNDAPVAVDDTAATGFDNPVVIAVLANDSDVDGDVLSVAAVTQGVNGGLVEIQPDQAVRYAPPAGFGGSDSFTYIASDGVAQSAPATVTVSVQANSAPVVVNDTALVAEDAMVVVAVLANDSDADGDPLTITGFAQGANGTVTLNPDNTLTYRPAANFTGTDSFTYQVSDGQATNTGTVTVTVTAVNDAPLAYPDTIAVDTQATFVLAAPGVLANDHDPDGDALTAILQGNVAEGNVTLNSDGSFTYSPLDEWVGTETFTYQASDGMLTSGLATVTLVKELVAKEVVFKNEGGNKPQEWLIKGKSTQPGSTVTLYVGALPGGPVIGSTVVSQDGRFTFRDRGTLVAPDPSLRISMLSSTGARLIDVPVTVQGTVPAAAPALVPLNAGLRLTDSVTLDVVQYDPATNALTLSGSATSQATLTISLDNAILGTTQANGDGRWSFDAGNVRGPVQTSILRVESAGGARVERGLDIGGAP